MLPKKKAHRWRPTPTKTKQRLKEAMVGRRSSVSVGVLSCACVCAVACMVGTCGGDDDDGVWQRSGGDGLKEARNMWVSGEGAMGIPQSGLADGGLPVRVWGVFVCVVVMMPRCVFGWVWWGKQARPLSRLRPSSP